MRICNAQELIEASKKYSTIICFGLGKNFEKLLLLFDDTEIWEKVECIVDNDVEKQGKSKIVKGKELNVISLPAFKKDSYANLAIIVTPYSYESIVSQIEKDERLKEADVFCLAHTLALAEEEGILNAFLPSNIKLYREPLIPKVIHYCWFGGKPIPDKYKIYIESWHKFCPDYEIIEWNEQNYDITKNTYMYQAYERGMWAFVPDYARLDIIYQHGGIYLDTDVEVLQSMDDLLYQKGFAGFESQDHVALGLGFGAVKELPIIKAMRNMYDGMEFDVQGQDACLIPSSHWQTQLLKKYGLCANGEYQIVESMTVYPIKVLNGRKVFRAHYGTYLPKAIHHYELSSWNKRSAEGIVTFDRDMEKYYWDGRM